MVSFYNGSGQTLQQLKKYDLNKTKLFFFNRKYSASFSYYSFYDMIHQKKTIQNLKIIVTDVSFNRQNNEKIRNENNFYNS